jgi:acyl dehydratase
VPAEKTRERRKDSAHRKYFSRISRKILYTNAKLCLFWQPEGACKTLSISSFNNYLMEIDQQFTYSYSFTQADVEQFARLTGDHNPIHLDADYAAKTAFRRPIMHGFLAGSIFSKVMGTLFPGEGTVYLKQTMEFLQPMYVDIEYEAVFTVVEIGERSTATIRTQVFEKASRKETIRGEAQVMNRQKIERRR